MIKGGFLKLQKKYDYIELMNRSIVNLVKKALRISLTNPFYAGFILRTIGWQKKAAILRKYWESKNVHVPPFMISSITRRCNLKCKGCYSNAFNNSSFSEMSDEKYKSVIREASELGISIILIAGGEPFARSKLLDITKSFPKVIFPIFTNGLLINDETIKKLKKQRNVIPIISIEGFESETDNRRGKGVYKKTQVIMKKMKKDKIFFGISLTVTRDNFPLITSEDFIKEQVHMGCKVIFYVEYVPVEQDTESLVITQEQRKELETRLDQFSSEYRSLFISFPGDEAKFGGCLSSGRGFVHINPEGGLEPCPFAPYSDVNLKFFSLKEALQSEFLKKIRQSPEHLKETDCGCALWNNSEWVRSLLHKDKNIYNKGANFNEN